MIVICYIFYLNGKKNKLTPARVILKLIQYENWSTNLGHRNGAIRYDRLINYL